MVTIKFKGDAELGYQICAALVGNRAFIENDIVVNYDRPGEIFISLGGESQNDLELEMELAK